MKRTATATAITIALALGGTILAGAAIGSSHREAPLVTETPKVDGTDFYMFRSYENNRGGFVTFLANYQPLQDPYGGPTYFQMDPDALYVINIDNDGDALADQAYYFRFFNKIKGLTVPVGGKDIKVPLVNIGPFGSTRAQEANRNLTESYVVVTQKRGESPKIAKNISRFGDVRFIKPFSNIGNKSIPNYAAYSDRQIARIEIDGCAQEGRVFAGQRNDGFKINLGEVFDLINTNPVGPRNGERDILADKNVTTLALELPIDCVVGDSAIIGAWTTAFYPNRRTGSMEQASRLAAPLVNEVVIGLPDKDTYNASDPSNDSQFANYVTNPSLPILIQKLFGVKAPTKYPRTDLVAVFLTGVNGLNKPASVTPAEMMRVNLAIDPKTAANQNSLGVLGGDLAGYPNGRRPGDDVVDISLRVLMGALLPAADAPDGQLPYTDGAIIRATDFRNTFPYLNTAIPGSPNPPAGSPDPAG
jgi:hypothetical protein